jgi:hypothetical protein
MRPSFAPSVEGFAPRVCACGRSLPAATTGRPRTSCSTACRRERDRVGRRLERRLEWQQLWRQLARAGEVTPPQAQREVENIQVEIDALRGNASTAKTQNSFADSARGNAPAVPVTDLQP